MKDMPKAYDHSAVEQTLYDRWEKAGYFHAAPNPDKTPYTIVIPPPNITGKLHMGHALDETLQDAAGHGPCFHRHRGEDRGADGQGGHR